jgi:signal transduction histidine kinase
VLIVPLGIQIGSAAKERALTFGRSDARALAPILSLAGNPSVTGSVVAVAQLARPRIVNVIFSDGSVLGAGEVLEPDPFDDPVALRRSRRGEAFTSPLGRDVMIYEPVPRSNGTTAVVRVLVPSSQIRRGVTRAWLLLGLLGLFLIGLALWVSDRIGRSVVGSVRKLADSANRIGTGDVTQRVALEGTVEVRDVGIALNNLAARIDELLNTERAAVADLQHRLRTPVTALRAEVGSLDDRDAVRRLEFGLEELTRTIDQIIRDAAQPIRSGIGISCDLCDVVGKRFAFWEVLAEDQHRDALLGLVEGPAVIAILASDAEAIVDVLIDNVFSHTPEGVGFRLEVQATADRVTLTVKDDGPGFSPHIDIKRGTSGRGSTGLGLDIVRRIVERANGTFSAGTREGGGATVQADFQRVGAAATGPT